MDQERPNIIELPIPPSQTFNQREELATYLDSFALQHGYSISCGRSHPKTLTFWCRRSGYPNHTNKTDKPVKSVKIGCPFEIIATETGTDEASTCWSFAPSCTKHNHPPDPAIKPRNRKPKKPKVTSDNLTTTSKLDKLTTTCTSEDLTSISHQLQTISTSSETKVLTTSNNLTATSHQLQTVPTSSESNAPTATDQPLNTNTADTSVSSPVANTVSGRLKIICSAINQLDADSQNEIVDTFEQILASRQKLGSSLFLLPPGSDMSPNHIQNTTQSPTSPFSFDDIFDHHYNNSATCHATKQDQPIPNKLELDTLFTVTKTVPPTATLIHQGGGGIPTTDDLTLSVIAPELAPVSKPLIPAKPMLILPTTTDQQSQTIITPIPEAFEPDTLLITTELADQSDTSSFPVDHHLLPNIACDPPTHQDQESQKEAPLPTIEKQVTITQEPDLKPKQKPQPVPVQVSRVTRKRARENDSQSTSKRQTRSKSGQPPIAKR